MVTALHRFLLYPFLFIHLFFVCEQCNVMSVYVFSDFLLVLSSFQTSIGNSGTCKQADVSAVAAFLARAGLKLK